MQKHFGLKHKNSVNVIFKRRFSVFSARIFFCKRNDFLITNFKQCDTFLVTKLTPFIVASFAFFSLNNDNKNQLSLINQLGELIDFRKITFLGQKDYWAMEMKTPFIVMYDSLLNFVRRFSWNS